METVVRKIGNSQGITIAKPLCDELDIGVGSKVDICVDGPCLVIRPVDAKTQPRIGIARGKKLVVEGYFSREFDDEIATMLGGQ